AHLVVAGFGTGIAEGGSGIDAAGFVDRACSREDGFEKCGFTALERAHQRNAPWTSGTSDVLSHSPPPWVRSSARDWVGKGSCSACPYVLASEKSSLRCGGARSSVTCPRSSRREAKAALRGR